MKKYLILFLVVVAAAILLFDLYYQIRMFIIGKRIDYWNWQSRRKNAGAVVSAAK